MPRRKAWKGTPPDTPAQARRILLEAARLCVERSGLSKASLRDVAEEAGVTRQTVYRYFEDAEDLFHSAAALSSDGFLQRLRAQVRHQDTPAHRIVECLVFAITEIPRDPHLSSLMTADGRPGVSFLLSLRFVQEDLEALAEHNLSEAMLDEVAEILVRLLHSFLSDPGDARTASELRATLRRWLVPMIEASISEK